MSRPLSAPSRSAVGPRQTIRRRRRRKFWGFVYPRSLILSLVSPSSGWWGGGVPTRCRALMDSLTRCVSGRSEDAIMPVMAVRAKTGTHQDESKRSVRGAADAPSWLLGLSKSHVRDPDAAACHCGAPPPPTPPNLFPSGMQRRIVISKSPPSFPAPEPDVPGFNLFVRETVFNERENPCNTLRFASVFRRLR